MTKLNKSERFVIAFLGVTPRNARTVSDVEGMARVNGIKPAPLHKAIGSLKQVRGMARQVDGMGPSNRDIGLQLTIDGRNEFKRIMGSIKRAN